MKPFTLLIKPVGAACNLECGYCFYRGHEGGAIRREILERALATYSELPFAAKSVTLQGGEPLLAPSFVLDIMERYAIECAIQTNATLVTGEIARRLAACGWLVGVSLDGPKPLHEAARGGNFDAVVRGVRELEAAGADYNFLTVVSKANVRHAREVYRFLRDNFATRFHQYIECTGPRAEFAVSGDEWGDFLIELFDEWIQRDAHEVSIRLFESIASSVVCGRPMQCSFARDCRHHLVLEYDGSVYPCDFHVRQDLRLGNIMTHTWQEMLESDTYRLFANAKTASLPQECRTCRYLDFCNGDCPRNRRSLCKGWKRFFEHSLERIALLAVASATNDVD